MWASASLGQVGPLGGQRLGRFAEVPSEALALSALADHQRLRPTPRRESIVHLPAFKINQGILV